MRAPEFVIRRVLSWFVRSLALWLMKSFEVKSDHDVLSVLMDSVILSVFILYFSGIVISSVNQELLGSALWLLDNVSDENWHVRDLELGPSLTFVP